MSNKRQIKRRISAAGNISKITKAMEMVSASKMKRAQDQAMAARDYALALHHSLEKVGSNADPSLHPLLSSPTEGLDILLVIATNKGLCGSLNAQLWKETVAWKKAHPQGEAMAVGKKGVHFCNLSALPLQAQFTTLPEAISSKDVVVISDLLIKNFLENKYKSVTVLYMDFVNTLSQRPKQIQLLPLKKELPETVREDVLVENLGLPAEYLFEPSPKFILNTLLPFYIENTIYQAFLESRASEHSARMVTMKNASENANELVSELKLQFNKSRQAAITAELLDIATASLTL